jgi:hypothetical protein
MKLRTIKDLIEITCLEEGSGAVEFKAISDWQKDYLAERDFPFRQGRRIISSHFVDPPARRDLEWRALSLTGENKF